MFKNHNQKRDGHVSGEMNNGMEVTNYYDTNSKQTKPFFKYDVLGQLVAAYNKDGTITEYNCDASGIRVPQVRDESQLDLLEDVFVTDGQAVKQNVQEANTSEDIVTYYYYDASNNRINPPQPQKTLMFVP